MNNRYWAVAGKIVTTLILWVSMGIVATIEHPVCFVLRICAVAYVFSVCAMWVWRAKP